MIDVIYADIGSLLLLSFVIGSLFILAVYAVPPLRFRKTVHWNELERAKLTDEYRKTMAQILGGVALILGFAYSIVKDGDAKNQSRTQLAVQQYTEAVKLLGSQDATARSASIYALEKVVGSRAEYHAPVVATLAAFLRAAPGQTRLPELNFYRPAPIGPDRQAAIDVLGRRERSLDDPLRIVDLRGAYLAHGNFHGLHSFSGAYFAQAKLFGVDMRHAELEGANFEGATFNDYEAHGDPLSDPAKWESWEHHEFGADFTKAKLKNASFENAGLCGAIFSEAELEGAKFSGANLTRANFSKAVGLNPNLLSGACSDGGTIFPNNDSLHLKTCPK